MDGERDLFASTSLFTSFDDPFISTMPSQGGHKSAEESCDSYKGVDVHLNGDSDDDNNCIALVEQEELIVLDETGSSESDNNENSDSKELDNNNKGDSTGNEDHDIEIIESESESSTKAVGSSNPLEITLEDDVVHDKRNNTCHNCFHKVELSRLSKENASLRQQINQQESRFSAINNSELGIEIKFLRPSSSRKYRTIFENFIKSLEDSQEETAATNDEKAGQEVFSDFCIDRTAALESTKASASCAASWKVPRYNQDLKDALKKDEVEILPEQSPKMSSKATCFNCLGDHMIANCPKQKDRRRIAENRDAFMIKCGNKSMRYHADEDLRFANIKPGRLSERLRKALDLGKHEVPFFIYKMRLLGYPPGWLKEAEITSSGLTVYDSEGKEVIEDNVEDGEVYDSSTVRVQHDPEKLVEFPGFNVYLPYGFKDDHVRYGFPPIQNHHLKSNLGKSMKAPEAQPYKRRIPQNVSNGKRSKVADGGANLDDVGMDIEEIDVEPIDQTPSTSQSSRDKCDQADTDVQLNGRTSPSLEELEQVKKKLLNVLSSDSNSVVCSSDTNSQSEVEIEALPEAKSPISKGKDSMCNTPDKQIERQASISKSVELGSPSIIKMCKADLPSRKSFSVGITEHLPFENLPGATGQFEKLRGVLKTIRNCKC